MTKKAEEKKTTASPIKLTRIEANLIAIYKLGIDAQRDDLAKLADKLYVKSGGSPNLKEAKWHASFGLKFFAGAVKAGFVIESAKKS